MSSPTFHRAPRAKKTGFVIVLALIVGFLYPVQANANANIYLLQTSNIRFGNGAETSIGSDGFLKQPFYKNLSGGWSKLTYATYPLRYAIGTNDDTYSGGTGWNIAGNIMNSEVSGFSSDSTISPSISRS